MLKYFVDRFDKRREELSEAFRLNEGYFGYDELVKLVVIRLQAEDIYGENNPDPTRIQRVDFGDYQGTMVFVVGAVGFQPSMHWVVPVGYGSCSGCDSLQAAHDDAPEMRVQMLMTLALHIVQGLKEVNYY